MTQGDERKSSPDETRAALSSADELELDVRKLLRGSAVAVPAPDVLRGVQKKLRQRSGGKFYRDRWSTSKHPPVATYLVTSAIMLAVMATAYAILSPLVGEPTPVRNEPAPVRVVLPPPR